MSFPRYPKYKPSGIEWLGEVPEHWGVKRLKGLCRLVTEKADARNRAVALEHIESGTGRLVGDSGEFEGEGTAFRRGDLLFGKLRPYLAKAWVAEFDGEAVGDFHVMRPARELSQRYLLYTTLNRDFIQLVDGSTYGSKMPRASWDFVGCMPVCEPPLADQRAIAAFLDRETSKIDSLIAEQEKLIELLAEKRQAVISHAVTKGLNPAAPMKPSGVEWLGDVPAHWQVVPLRWFLRVRSGDFRSVDDMRKDPDETSRYPVIGGNGITGYTRDANVEGHTIAIGRVGALCGNVHEVRGPAWITDNALVIHEPRSFEPSYLAHVIEQRNLNSLANKSAQPLITGEMVGALRCPLPSREEQASIVNFAQRVRTHADVLSAEAGRATSILRERRTALISAAVTGQIDVRNAVPEHVA